MEIRTESNTSDNDADVVLKLNENESRSRIYLHLDGIDKYVMFDKEGLDDFVTALEILKRRMKI